MSKLKGVNLLDLMTKASAEDIRRKYEDKRKGATFKSPTLSLRGLRARPLSSFKNGSKDCVQRENLSQPLSRSQVETTAQDNSAEADRSVRMEVRGSGSLLDKEDEGRGEDTPRSTRTSNLEANIGDSGTQFVISAEVHKQQETLPNVGAETGIFAVPTSRAPRSLPKSIQSSYLLSQLKATANQIFLIYGQDVMQQLFSILVVYFLSLIEENNPDVQSHQANPERAEFVAEIENFFHNYARNFHQNFPDMDNMSSVSGYQPSQVSNASFFRPIPARNFHQNLPDMDNMSSVSGYQPSQVSNASFFRPTRVLPRHDSMLPLSNLSTFGPGVYPQYPSFVDEPLLRPYDMQAYNMGRFMDSNMNGSVAGSIYQREDPYQMSSMQNRSSMGPVGGCYQMPMPMRMNSHIYRPLRELNFSSLQPANQASFFKSNTFMNNDDAMSDRMSMGKNFTLRGHSMEDRKRHLINMENRQGYDMDGRPSQGYNMEGRWQQRYNMEDMSMCGYNMNDKKTQGFTMDSSRQGLNLADRENILREVRKPLASPLQPTVVLRRMDEGVARRVEESLDEAESTLRCNLRREEDKRRSRQANTPALRTTNNARHMAMGKYHELAGQSNQTKTAARGHPHQPTPYLHPQSTRRHQPQPAQSREMVSTPYTDKSRNQSAILHVTRSGRAVRAPQNFWSSDELALSQSKRTIQPTRGKRKREDMLRS